MYLRVWFFALLFANSLTSSINARPSGASKCGDTDEAGEGNPPLEKKPRIEPESEHECYYSKLRKTELETNDRPVVSRISTTCSGERYKLSSFANQETYDKGKGFGTESEFDLIQCRTGKFIFKFDEHEMLQWEEVYICQSHLDELSRNYNSITYHHTNRHKVHGKWEITCGFPSHATILTLGGREHYVEKGEAALYLRSSGILLPVGLPICREHKEYLQKLQDEAFGDYEFMDDDMKRMAESALDLSLTQPTPEDPEAAACQNVKTSFFTFAKAANVCRIPGRKEFSKYKADTKHRKVRSIRTLEDVMISIIAPGDEEELSAMVRQSYRKKDDEWSGDAKEVFKELMEEISRQYLEEARSRRDREIILSLVANILPYAVVHYYIPGLSSRQYYKAIRIAIRHRPAKEPKLVRERYDRKKVETFVTFVTSPQITIGLPYGTRICHLSNGEKIDVMDTLRIHRIHEIIRQYYQYLKETNQQDMRLSESTLYHILKTLTATQRHQLTCVDSYLADALNAFRDIDESLSRIVGLGLLDVTHTKKLRKMFLESKQYFRTDFKMHTMNESKVADHCFRHALSDPSDKRFSTKEHHNHLYMCPRCQLLDQAFIELHEDMEAVSQITTATDPFRKELDDMKRGMILNENKILEYKRHQLRASFTSRQREDQIAVLQENEALVTVDFPQKWLPTSATEPQSLWFGKSGLSWHVTHVLVNISGHLVQHTMAHVLGQVKQGSRTVTQILEHVLHQLYSVGVRVVHIRSDNAAAYHSSSTIASIQKIAARTKMTVRTVSFSEAQNGKSSADRMMAIIKRKVRDHLADDKADANTADELYSAMVSEPRIRAFSAYLATVQPVAKVENNIDLISELGHFEYHAKHIQAWKFHGIGEGMKIDHSLQENGGRLKILKSGGYLPQPTHDQTIREHIKEGKKTFFWFNDISKKSTIEHEEDDDVDDVAATGSFPTAAHKGGDGLFDCPTCGATFLRYDTLLTHTERGKCMIRPEKIVLYDYALGLYKRKLEGIEDARLVRSAAEAIRTLVGEKNFHPLAEGWAHKAKRQSKRLNPDAKKFVEELFERGNSGGRKVDHFEAEKLMMAASHIPRDERMTAKQISSYYSRLAKKRDEEAAGRWKRHMPGKDDEPEDEEEEEEEENECPLLYEQEDDFLLRIIKENKHKLFLV